MDIQRINIKLTPPPHNSPDNLKQSGRKNDNKLEERMKLILWAQPDPLLTDSYFSNMTATL